MAQTPVNAQPDAGKKLFMAKTRTPRADPMQFINNLLVGNQKMPRSVQLDLLLRVHFAMYSACMEGALRADWQELANAINFCHAVCEVAKNTAHAEAIVDAAQTSLIALGRRRLKGDETPITNAERKTLHAMLDLYETLLGEVKVREFNAAVSLVDKRLKQGDRIARVQDMKGSTT